MGAVARALVLHELSERARDRWVLVISALFTLLATAVSLYGRSAEGNALQITGPSLVTLASLLVPLVALVLGHDAIVGERERNTLGLLLSLPIGRFEVIAAKFAGRGLALTAAVAGGLLVSIFFAGEGQAEMLQAVVGPTLLLGLAFLALGMLISSAVTRQVTAASLVVVAWFLLVFFYDLGLMALLVITDGAVAQETVAWLVAANPAGLYRIEMLERLSGPEALANLGLVVELPAAGVRSGIWFAAIFGPLLASGVLLARGGAVR